MILTSSRPLLAVTGLGAVLLVALAVAVLGPLVASAGLLTAIASVLLLADARRAVILAMGLIVLVEGNKYWGISAVYALWEARVAKSSVLDLLLYAAFAAVAVHMVRRRMILLPAPFTGPLLSFGVLLIAGSAWSVLGGTDVRSQLVSTFQTFVPTLLVPFAVVNVIDHGTDLRRVIGGYAGLAGAKAATGLFVVFTGLSAAAGNDPGLTFYEPAANLFGMVALLALIAAVAARVRLPRWTIVVGLFVILSLLFSYRRSYWLATTLCVLLVLLVASGRVGRRLAIPAAFLVAVTVYLSLQSGIAGDPSGTLVTRVESINPTAVARNDQDRYRLTERRNTLAAIEQHPLTGIGVGVEWPQRYPLNFEEPGLQFYAHTALIWHWLKFGVLGALAYLWLIGAAVICGLRVFRRHPDRLVACCGLAAGVGFVGLAVVELAATVIGPDLRAGVVAGLLLGLLAVAQRGLPGGPAAATGRLPAA